MKCIYCGNLMTNDSDEDFEYHYCSCGAVKSEYGFESKEDLIRIVGKN